MKRLRRAAAAALLALPVPGAAASLRLLPVPASIAPLRPAAGPVLLPARQAFSAPAPLSALLPSPALSAAIAIAPSSPLVLSAIGPSEDPARAALPAAAQLEAAAANIQAAARVSDAGAQDQLRAAFDGGAPPDGPLTTQDAEGGAPVLPAYLTVPDPAHERWIAEVVEQAARSRTGRAVLARAKRLAEERGRPILVTVAPIGNAGEYSFDHEIVTMDKAWMKRDPEHAAPVFAHELQHVLQLAQDLPADAFEMELEAYLIQFRIGEEIGLKVRASNSFHWRAFRRFKNDVDRFIVWLKKEYPNNLAIVGDGLAAYELKLIERHLKLVDEHARLEKRRAKKQAILDRMTASGQPDSAVESYRLDEVAPFDDKLRQKEREIAWAERDLALLRDPQARAKYQAYAARVLKKARAYHARLGAAR